MNGMEIAKRWGLALGLAMTVVPAVEASSHREAPLISSQTPYDNTDVYAFISPEPGHERDAVLIANFIPLTKPEAGPNFHYFASDAVYDIHVDNNGDALADITFRFIFNKPQIISGDTFLFNNGEVTALDDENLNVRQTYTYQVLRPGQRPIQISKIPVAPDNVGNASMPDYEKLAAQAVKEYAEDDNGFKFGAKIRLFAGQRAEQFYIDLGATFDLLRYVPQTPINGTARTNVHSIALELPRRFLMQGGREPRRPTDPNWIVGIWSTVSRQQVPALTPSARPSGGYIQVSRLGNPLVNEVVIPLKDKDKFNGSRPKDDGRNFLSYVTDPELARLFTALFQLPVPATPRNDLVQVFLTGIPKLTERVGATACEYLRLNLSILATKEPNRMGVIGGDNQGFPNGRRVIDDVLDIALQAVGGILDPKFKETASKLTDNVDGPDTPILKVFPFLGTPHAGRVR
jgi:hypothetical protein